MKLNLKNKLKNSLGFMTIFTSERLYWSIVIILILTPVIYFSYLFLTVRNLSANFIGTLSANPEISVMVIVSFVDIILGYYLWQDHSKLINNRRALKKIYLSLLLFQTLLGNLLIIFLSGLGILKIKKLTSRDDINPQGLNLVLGFSSIIYAFCCLMICCIYL